MDVQYIIKFTRCPRCNSFSLKELSPEDDTNKSGIFSKNTLICNNCGYRYVLQGNSLKEISSQTERIEKTERKIPEAESFVPKIEQTNKNKKVTKTALILIGIIGLLMFGIFLYFHFSNSNNNPLNFSKLHEKESTSTTASTMETQIAKKEPKPEKRKNEDSQAATSETEEQVSIVNSEDSQESKEENEPIEPQNANDSSGPRPEDEAKSQGEAFHLPPTDDPHEELNPIKENSLGKQHAKAYKIFEYSSLKVRSSSPHTSDHSHRWYFNRKDITISREESQQVFIAGDPNGKRNWAVDDELQINGERIKGCSEVGNKQGNIPHSIRIKPLDITHLIPSNQETKLDIRLVDYGIFWGNTALYIVVI